MVKIFLSKGDKSLINELVLNVLKTEYSLNYNDADIKKDGDGKLYVNACPYNISVTHSKGNLAMAVSTKKIGIDMEVIKTDYKPRPIFGVTPTNAEDYAVLWTKAESLVKLYSEGKFDLRKISLAGAPCHDGVNLTANLYTFTEDNLVISVATEESGYELIYKDF